MSVSGLNQKTVKKENTIPKPLGFGFVCMLLRFGTSINFFLKEWDKCFVFLLNDGIYAPSKLSLTASLTSLDK